MHNETNNNQHNGKTMSIVWCCDEALAKQKCKLSDAEFLFELGRLFGNKLGRILSCSQRYSYPLALATTEPYVGHRTICVGNAAQTLHPIAGQGFNLGIRDVYSLVQVLQTNKLEDPGKFDITQAYKAARYTDKQATIGLTDGLVNIFSNQHVPLVMGRNLALLGLNKSAFLKNKFASFAMGKR